MDLQQFITWAVAEHGCEIVDIPGFTGPRGEAYSRVLKRTLDGRTRTAAIPRAEPAATAWVIRGLCNQLGIECPVEHPPFETLQTRRAN